MSLFDNKGAVLSPCGHYRYVLHRLWEDRPRQELCVIGLNPSTADAETDDPTVVRLCRRARLLGYSGLYLVNLFAFRATDPRELRKVGDPIGPDNDAAILQNAVWCKTILCAWGGAGAYLARGERVRDMLRYHFPGTPLYCLRVGKDGSPAHPLYLKYELPFQRWEP